MVTGLNFEFIYSFIFCFAITLKYHRADKMKAFIAVLLLFSSADSKCYSPSSEPVDWFVMLKRPGSYDFVYSDAENPNLKISRSNLTCESNPVGKTIAGIYSGRIENYLMYNDEVPDGPTTYNRGHTKGGTTMFLVKMVSILLQF